MIIINNFEIVNNGTRLNIDVETNIGYTINSILLWDINSFKDYSLSYNLSSYLSQTSNIESFYIDAIDLGIEKFEDILFLEVKDNYVEPECECPSKPGIGIVYNLLPYYKCMLNYILKTNINNCNNDIEINNIITINLLIDSIEKALEVGFYLQAIDLLKKLKKLCDITSCNNCKNVTCNSCSKFKQVTIT